MEHVNILVDDPKDSLRKLRDKECFPIINRGKLWYDALTFDQLSELKVWYWDWLDVTDTMIIPVKPSWLKDKLSEEIVI